jgi:Flp pilus assembly protein TadG
MLPLKSFITPKRTASRSQHGQAAVLLALLMAALLVFTGLVFMAGASYVSRRNLQQVADDFALSFGSKISGATCTSSALTTPNVKAYGDYADSVLASSISNSTSSSTTGSCSTGWTLVYNHPNSLIVTLTYPYNGDYRDVLASVAATTPLQFSGFLGVSNANIAARAVARHAGGGIGTGYAVMARTALACSGSGAINVLGSVYSKSTSTTTGCGIYAHAIKDSYGVYNDYGNFSVYDDGSPWGSSNTFSNCSAQLCADGFELAGHLTPTCGTTGSTMYLDSTDLVENPNPCSFSYVPPVPLLGYPLYPEPNTSYPNSNTGAPYCSAATAYSDGTGHVAPTLTSGVLHFHPGCYSTLDISSYSTGTPLFDPGFYYFNGVGTAKGGGLCLGSTARLLGTDVSLEFVNQTSMSSTNCQTTPTGSCGVSSNCGFGADSTSPFSPPPATGSAWCGATCPLAGVLVWSSSTGSFFVKGGGEKSWFAGTIFWPSACSWDANGGSSLQGQLVCDTASLQSGSGTTGAVVSYSDIGTSQGRGETILIE